MPRRLPCFAFALALLLMPLAAPAAVPTAFTYQGQLLVSGAPVTGTYDVTFRLWDSASGGTQISGDLPFAGLSVTQGLFSVDLDFGPGAFDGSSRGLEVIVRGPGDGSPTTLAPRQAITSAPYAIYSAGANGAGGGGSNPWLASGLGIYYTGGNVGVGTSPISNTLMAVNAGGANLIPFSVGNNNATYAALYVHNSSGANGYGLFDDTSGRAYLHGQLNVGAIAPNYTPQIYTSGTGQGVYSTTVGYLANPGDNAAVEGVGTSGNPLLGLTPAIGVVGRSTDSRGVSGISTNSWGVSGDCTSAGTYGILGTPGEGVYGYSSTSAKPGGHFVNTVSGGVALKADGLAQVKTLQILGADLAESFPVAGDGAEPGTVLAISGEGEGTLRVCDEAYCRRVAGVVSGAHGLPAGVVLEGVAFDDPGHATVAVSGRVWVKCDAARGGIRIGDLLTTADRAGYAMRVADPSRATGAIVGKAMTSLETGSGLVLVLVSLQ